jgi:hypothetical protein
VKRAKPVAISDWTVPVGEIVDHDPPGTWRLVCGQCERCWAVALPETNARHFIRELTCECGANYMSFSVYRGMSRGPDIFRRELDEREPFNWSLL